MPGLMRLWCALITAAVLCAGGMTIAESKQATAQSNDQVMRDMAASAPPSWIKWLGWARDGTRVAWRQGTHGTGNVPGRPIWIARLDKRGAIVDRHHRRTEIQKALDSRGIRRRAQAEIEEVSALDVLVRSRAGEVLAVAVRGSPPVLAILRNADGEYHVVARRQVIGPVARLRVNAAEQPAGRMMAIVAHTGREQRRQGSLFIVPLQPKVTQVEGVQLPKQVTPVATTPRGKRATKSP